MALLSLQNSCCLCAVYNDYVSETFTWNKHSEMLVRLLGNCGSPLDNSGHDSMAKTMCSLCARCFTNASGSVSFTGIPESWGVGLMPYSGLIPKKWKSNPGSSQPCRQPRIGRGGGCPISPSNLEFLQTAVSRSKILWKSRKELLSESHSSRDARPTALSPGFGIQ